MENHNIISKVSRLGKITKKISLTTGVLIAIAALMNSSVDVVKAILNVPATFAEKQDTMLFKKHFKELPLHHVDIPIKMKNSAVSMFLDVYENGDIYIKYAANEKWFPLEESKEIVSVFSVIPEAKAEVNNPTSETGTGTLSSTKSITFIDVYGKWIERNELERKIKAREIDKFDQTYLLAHEQDLHPYLFGTYEGEYTATFEPELGYEFKGFSTKIISEKKSEIVNVHRENGAIKVLFKLKSGPILDQWNGWIKMEIKTVQVLKK